MIKSISFSQEEILQNIIDLHTGPIQADVSFGSGCFYKNGTPQPRLCFDISPKVSGVIPADVCHLPIKDNCLRTVMFDPPFMLYTGPGSKIKDRFGFLRGSMKNLWQFYGDAMMEIHRTLIIGGWLIFKCQDGVSSQVNHFTHAEIYQMAQKIGFIPRDLFVLLAKSRMPDPQGRKQQHARKFHSYFWVFRKSG